jgi:hypothetical protein
VRLDPLALQKNPFPTSRNKYAVADDEVQLIGFIRA